jgi:hypothetical protein
MLAEILRGKVFRVKTLDRRDLKPCRSVHPSELMTWISGLYPTILMDCSPLEMPKSPTSPRMLLAN